jgi:hypothetical protein
MILTYITGDSSPAQDAPDQQIAFPRPSSGGGRRAIQERASRPANVFGSDYITALTIQTGNSGLILGQPSDPRIWGVTLRARF